MDPAMIRLVNTVKDHFYVSITIEGQRYPQLVCKGPHVGAIDPKVCWKAEVEKWLKENEVLTTPPSTADLAQQIFNELDEGAVMSQFIFLGAGFDHDGRRAVYSDAMPEMGIHETLGLLAWATHMAHMQLEGKN